MISEEAPCFSRVLYRLEISSENFTQSKTKANYIYELTPRGIRVKSAMTVQFLERKRDEYNDLKAEIERLEIELGLDEEEQPGEEIGPL